MADIIVERVADGDFLPPTPDILPQLTGAEWVANMPGTAREKKAFVTSCTVSCHSGDTPFRVTFDEASWRTLVHRMSRYHLRTLIRPAGRSGGGNGDLIADWLVRIEYVPPSPWSFDFNSWIDNSTEQPTYWYGDQHGYIVRIQPLPDAADAPVAVRAHPAPSAAVPAMPRVDPFDRNAQLWAMQRAGHESGWGRWQEIYLGFPICPPRMAPLYT